MVVLQALASALILPLDRVRERELQNAENAEPTEQAPEPVKPGAVPERPVYPTVGHSLLCVNAVAVGAITATWFWSQNIFEGCSTDVSNARWSEDFANASYDAADSITPFGAALLKKHVFNAGNDSEVARLRAELEAKDREIAELRSSLASSNGKDLGADI